MRYNFSTDCLNLTQIAESGQCFRWRRMDIASESWDFSDRSTYGIYACGKKLLITQQGNSFEACCKKSEWEDIWRDYLDMNTDYAAIGTKILTSGDEYLIRAYKFGYGIRILKQDLWEMIITFLISQNNNISRIRRSVQLLCERCTEDEHFPAASEIDLSIFDDSSLGLGYRNVYLREMCEYALEHPEFPENLRSMPYEEAQEKLMSFKGIGKKVADCVSLFGLHNIDAFPVDTHIKKILAAHYPHGFDHERYAGYRGIVQQYMFFYDLHGLKHV